MGLVRDVRVSASFRTSYVLSKLLSLFLLFQVLLSSSVEELLSVRPTAPPSLLIISFFCSWLWSRKTSEVRCWDFCTTNFPCSNSAYTDGCLSFRLARSKSRANIHGKSFKGILHAGKSCLLL